MPDAADTSGHDAECIDAVAMFIDFARPLLD